MLKPYDLLENLLIDIEKGIREDINASILADKYTLSERHLRRLFKFTFKQPLGSYIRLRKLTASLDDLVKADSNILDIAIAYCFSYEQSYIRAFKHEFGITPGDFRKAKPLDKTKLLLYSFDKNNFTSALFKDYFLERIL